VNNTDELVEKYCSDGGIHFNAMTSGTINSTELVATLINRKDSFGDGIRFAQDVIDGSASILILKEGGNLIAARDKLGRIPVLVGKNEDGYAVTFESFAYQKLGYEDERELGAGEIVEISPDKIEQLSPAQKKKKICAFLWSYYGYPTAKYEGINVEVMRCRNGAIMSENDKKLGKTSDIDYVCGVPDSGTPHAIGYANQSRIPFARPFIKYTPTWPRSFTTAKQADRKKVAKMKLIPVHELIEGKNLLFVDDSIVRGTQLRETVEFLYDNGAREVHMRSACPPIMYACKYLNFARSTSDMELIARRTIVELEGEEGLKYIEEYSDANTERGKKLREAICKKLNFASLEFQSLEGIIEAIGLDADELCTYCWNGKE
jgi:amidophosphoribosyltransferase